MSDVYIKIRDGKVVRSIDLGDGVILDRGENEDIVGVEILNARGIQLNGKSIDHD